MTFERWLKISLLERGMSETRAEAVLDFIKRAPVNTQMNDRWGDDVKTYPTFMLRAFESRSLELALDWININLPEESDWYASLFLDMA